MRSVVRTLPAKTRNTTLPSVFQRWNHMIASGLQRCYRHTRYLCGRGAWLRIPDARTNLSVERDRRHRGLDLHTVGTAGRGGALHCHRNGVGRRERWGTIGGFREECLREIAVLLKIHIIARECTHEVRIVITRMTSDG